MIETAIVLPVIIFIIIVIIETTLLANAKSLVRYAAFCAARSASVGIVEGDNLKTSAIIPLLAISKKDAEQNTFANVLATRVPSDINAVLNSSLSAGSDFTSPKPLSFNKDVGASIQNAWARTYVRQTSDNSTVTVELLYFYATFFPLGRLVGLIDDIWENVPDDAVLQAKIKSIAGENVMNALRGTDYIPIIYTLTIPKNTGV